MIEILIALTVAGATADTKPVFPGSCSDFRQMEECPESYWGEEGCRGGIYPLIQGSWDSGAGGFLPQSGDSQICDAGRTWHVTDVSCKGFVCCGWECIDWEFWRACTAQCL